MRAGFVALAGKPNAGKSTLLNALLKQKLAIVSAKSQTTRSEIHGILNTEEAQIVFTDTPGIHKAQDRLGSRMNREAFSVMQGVDLVYLVVDGRAPFGKGDQVILDSLQKLQAPVFLILNKIDLLSKAEILEALQAWQKRYDFAEYFPLSALDQKDFQDLIQTTVSYLPEGGKMFPDDMVTDASRAFRMAEIVREKILSCTEQEVPHAAAVQIEDIEVQDDGSWQVRGLILVDKPGQKGILIGRQGRMIARIRHEAEQEISQVLQQKVHLELFVRVEPEWRNRDDKITSYGYGPQDDHE